MKGNYKLVTRYISAGKISYIYCTDTGNKYTRWLYAGRNTADNAWQSYLTYDKGRPNL